MIVVGLTGEIGTGKTKTTQILKKMGYKKFAISNGVYAFEDHEIKNIIKINNERN